MSWSESWGFMGKASLKLSWCFSILEKLKCLKQIYGKGQYDDVENLFKFKFMHKKVLFWKVYWFNKTEIKKSKYIINDYRDLKSIILLFNNDCS